MHTDLNQPQALVRTLRSLPAAAAEPYGFEEFERRAQRHRQAHRRRSAGAAVALLAVTLLIGMAFSLRWHAAPRLAQRTALPAAEVPQGWSSAPVHEPALVHVGTHAAVLGLEDRIAQVDDLLSAAGAARAPPAGLAALQQERNRLAGALVQVRYAETLVDASQ